MSVHRAGLVFLPPVEELQASSPLVPGSGYGAVGWLTAFGVVIRLRNISFFAWFSLWGRRSVILVEVLHWMFVFSLGYCQSNQIPIFAVCVSMLCAFLFLSIFLALFDSSAEEGERKQGEREGMTCSKWSPGRESNPGLLQQGRSLCTWDARSTN